MWNGERLLFRQLRALEACWLCANCYSIDAVMGTEGGGKGRGGGRREVVSPPPRGSLTYHLLLFLADSSISGDCIVEGGETEAENSLVANEKEEDLVEKKGRYSKLVF